MLISYEIVFYNIIYFCKFRVQRFINYLFIKMKSFCKVFYFVQIIN